MARHGTVSQDTKIKPDKSRVEFMAEYDFITNNHIQIPTKL